MATWRRGKFKSPTDFTRSNFQISRLLRLPFTNNEGRSGVPAKFKMENPATYGCAISKRYFRLGLLIKMFVSLIGILGPVILYFFVRAQFQAEGSKLTDSLLVFFFVLCGVPFLVEGLSILLCILVFILAGKPTAKRLLIPLGVVGVLNLAYFVWLIVLSFLVNGVVKKLSSCFGPSGFMTSLMTVMAWLFIKQQKMAGNQVAPAAVQGEAPGEPAGYAGYPGYPPVPRGRPYTQRVDDVTTPPPPPPAAQQRREENGGTTETPQT